MILKELYDLLFGSYNIIQKGLVILALIAFITLTLRDPIRGREATQRSIETFANILILILAGIALGSVIQAVVPKEIIAKTLGAKSGLPGILLATGIGAVMPGGPYVLYPILASLYAAGADISPIVAFIIAWSTIAFGRVPIELAFFDLKIVATRIIVGIPLPIIAGYLTKVVVNLVS
ncbi:MAG: permease [Candidatus Geothermarchaeales archaeon]